MPIAGEEVTQAGAAVVQSSEADVPPASRSTSSTDVVELLLTHHRVIAVCGAVGLLIFAVIALLLPVHYVSVARLMPPDQPSSTATSLAVGLAGRTTDDLSSSMGSFLGLRSSGALFVSIMQSRSLQDSLVEQNDLRKVYRVREWGGARKRLAEHTSISEDRKSGIITISVDDRDRYRAQAMAQAYIRELNKRVVQLNTGSARREREFLEQRLEAVRAQLGEANGKFSDFASKNNAINIPEQGKVMVEGVARVQGELIAAESELSGLRRIYGPENARVKATEGRVSELRRQVDSMTGKSIANADSVSPSIRQLPVLGVTYAELSRDAKIQEAVFESLSKQYEMAKVQEAKEIPTVRTLDEPDLPERKVGPPRTLITLMGGLLGALACAGVIVGRALWAGLDAQDQRKVLIQKMAAVWAQDEHMALSTLRRRKEN